MEQLWVALLAVATTLSVSGVSGSVLHGLAGGPAYPQLIPYKVAYTNVHHPLLLSPLHGLQIDETLAIPGNNEAVLAEGKQQDPAPAPVAENSSDELVKDTYLTQDQLYQHVFGVEPLPSEDDNAIKGGAPSAELETVPSISESEISTPAVQEPQTAQEPSSVDSSLLTTSTSSEKNEPFEIPASITTTKRIGGVYINSDEGKLQMQATLVSGGEAGVKVSVGEIPELAVDSVPIIVPDLPAPGIIVKHPKPHGVANVNVNVNVNVNGDGTGSVVNSTSVAEITAPIKTGHKKSE